MIGEKAAGGTNGCLPTGVASRLASLFAHRSVVDLGCGVGQYGRYFKENASNVHWVGVDGAEMVEEATNGLVRFADLSVGLPSWLVRSKRPDWVMSALRRCRCRSVAAIVPEILRCPAFFAQ